VLQDFSFSATTVVYNVHHLVEYEERFRKNKFSDNRQPNEKRSNMAKAKKKVVKKTAKKKKK
jgi:hypothetical protein